MAGTDLTACLSVVVMLLLIAIDVFTVVVSLVGCGLARLGRRAGARCRTGAAVPARGCGSAARLGRDLQCSLTCITNDASA